MDFKIIIKFIKLKKNAKPLKHSALNINAMVGFKAEKGKPTLCFRALQKRGKMVTWEKKKILHTLRL